MPQEVTNEELARMIAKGFAGTATKEELAAVKTDVEGLATHLDKVERKLDRVLVNELDIHERWIKLLADKVGVQLSR